VAPATQNQALSALAFLYQEVLEMELGDLDDFQRAKRPERLPVVLTREEVRAVLTAMRGEARLAASLL
jgi:integrase